MFFKQYIKLNSETVRQNSFVLFNISLEISPRQFHPGEIGHTQKDASMWARAICSQVKRLVYCTLFFLVFLYTADSIKVPLGTRNCPLGSYCLVVIQAKHCSEYRMPKCPMLKQIATDQLPKQHVMN